MHDLVNTALIKKIIIKDTVFVKRRVYSILFCESFFLFMKREATEMHVNAVLTKCENCERLLTIHCEHGPIWHVSSMPN